MASAMTSALTRALKDVERGPQDAAAVALARQYARQIDDDPSTLWRLGPRLLEVLVELRMTPKVRAAVAATGGGASGDAGTGKRSPLDELRAKRDRRVYGAEAVDSTSS